MKIFILIRTKVVYENIDTNPASSYGVHFSSILYEIMELWRLEV